MQKLQSIWQKWLMNLVFLWFLIIDDSTDTDNGMLPIIVGSTIQNKRNTVREVLDEDIFYIGENSVGKLQNLS